MPGGRPGRAGGLQRSAGVAPCTGILDWDRFVDDLKRLDYHGAMSFETDGAVRAFPPELHPELLRLIAQTGRMFARKAGLEE